MGGRY